MGRPSAGWIKETKEITMVYRRKSKGRRLQSRKANLFLVAAGCNHGRGRRSGSARTLARRPDAATLGVTSRGIQGGSRGRAGRRSTAQRDDGVVVRRPGAESRLGGRAQRDDEGAKGRPLQIRHALHGSGRHGRRTGLRHCRRYGRGREEGGGPGRCRHGRAWERGLGGGPAAAAMGGRGTREEDGAEGRRRRHGRAREEGGERGGGRRHEGGR